MRTALIFIVAVFLGAISGLGAPWNYPLCAFAGYLAADFAARGRS